MADRWQELEDERRVIVTRSQLWQWTRPGQVLAYVATALAIGGGVIATDSADEPIAFVIACVLAAPAALLFSWRVRFEIRPREMIRHAGPLAFLTQHSVPLSNFSTVVCDYDRTLHNATISDDEQEGPETIELRYSYRVTLEGDGPSVRLGAFDCALEAERLAMTLASRFRLALVNLQDRPSTELVREAEHIGSWVVVRADN